MLGPSSDNLILWSRFLFRFFRPRCICLYFFGFWLLLLFYWGLFLFFGFLLYSCRFFFRNRCTFRSFNRLLRFLFRSRSRCFAGLFCLGFFSVIRLFIGPTPLIKARKIDFSNYLNTHGRLRTWFFGLILLLICSRRFLLLRFVSIRFGILNRRRESAIIFN